MKEKNLRYICISILLLNILFIDFIYFLNIGDFLNFDPISGNSDYLRHHSIARQVAEGQGFFSIFDSTLNEMPYIYGQPTTSIFYGFLIFISNDSHLFTFFFTLIFFSLLSFYFLSKLLFKLLNDKEKSLIITTIMLITGNFLFSFWYLIPKQIIQLDSLVMLHRIANPLISYPFLFLFMYLLYIYYESYLNSDFKKVRKYLIYLGLVFFLLVFSYFYFWTFALVSFGFIQIYLLYKFKKNHFKQFIYSNLLFLVFFIPALFIYLYNSYLQNNLSFYKEYLIRNGVIFTHTFLSAKYELFYLFILILIILMLIFSYKKNILEHFKLNFISILFISGYVCLYNNVITGLSVQKGHWFAFIIYPLFLLVLILFGLHLYKSYIFKFIKIKKILLVILIFITIFNLIFISYIGFKDYPNFFISNSEKELFTYLDQKDSRLIILTNENISRKIVGFTFHDTIFVDEIEKVSNFELEKRQNAFENYKSSCTIEYNFDYLISNNQNITCQNLILEKEFENIKLYKKVN